MDNRKFSNQKSIESPNKGIEENKRQSISNLKEPLFDRLSNERDLISPIYSDISITDTIESSNNQKTKDTPTQTNASSSQITIFPSSSSEVGSSTAIGIIVDKTITLQNELRQQAPSIAPYRITRTNQKTVSVRKNSHVSSRKNPRCRECLKTRLEGCPGGTGRGTCVLKMPQNSKKSKDKNKQF